MTQINLEDLGPLLLESTLYRLEVKLRLRFVLMFEYLTNDVQEREELWKRLDALEENPLPKGETPRVLTLTPLTSFIQVTCDPRSSLAAIFPALPFLTFFRRTLLQEKPKHMF